MTLRDSRRECFLSKQNLRLPDGAWNTMVTVSENGMTQAPGPQLTATLSRLSLDHS